MATIIGTDLNDVIVGTTVADRIEGGAGNDRINGGAGDDDIFGGTGADILTGDAGNDRIFAEDGNDGVYGGGGNDLVDGGIGDDVLFGDGGNDTVIGGAGNDRLYGGVGNDRLDGGSGSDLVYGEAGDDVFVYRGGDGNDTFVGGGGNDRIEFQFRSADLTDSLRADLAAYQAWSAAQATAAGSSAALVSQTAGDAFTFSSLGLSISTVEGVTIFVDGQEVSLASLLNRAPTNVALSSMTVAENSSAGTVVGVLSGTDPDLGQSANLSFSLASPSDVFEIINGNQLVVKAGAALNFEGTNSFDIDVRATDAGGLSRVQTFTIALSDLNEAPTSVALSSTTVAENSSAGTVVGVLSGTDPDVDQSASLSFSLASPSDAFEIINGNQLVVKAGAGLNFEGKNSFDIDVRVTDAGSLSRVQTFTVNLSDVNEAPTSVALSSMTVAENSSAGTVVGVLSGTDPDMDQSANLSFSLASPSDVFEIINGNQLVVKAGAALNFEGTNSFDIDVRVTDAGGLSRVQTFTIALSDLNEAPTSVALSSTTVAENSSAGTVVGVLSGTDPDMDQSANLSFSLASPSDVFEIINGNQLVVKAGAALNFEGTNSFDIDVRATDAGGLSRVQTFTIALSDLNEAPTSVALSSTTVAENSSAGTVVGVLSGTDPDVDQSASLSFSLASPSDVFEIINGNQLVVKAGAALNFEGTNSFDIDVRVTDAGGSQQGPDVHDCTERPQ